jgi:hypothetical protein
MARGRPIYEGTREVKGSRTARMRKSGVRSQLGLGKLSDEVACKRSKLDRNHRGEQDISCWRSITKMQLATPHCAFLILYDATGKCSQCTPRESHHDKAVLGIYLMRCTMILENGLMTVCKSLGSPGLAKSCIFSEPFSLFSHALHLPFSYNHPTSPHPIHSAR